MRIKKQRFLSVILVLVLIVSSISALSLEAGATCRLKVKGASLSGVQATDIVSVAKANLGRTGRNLGAVEHWCVDFVISCARKANIDSSVIPDGSCVADFKNALLKAGAKKVKTPQAGDLLFYGTKHVGMMADSKNSYHGNYSGKGSGASFWNSSRVKYLDYKVPADYKRLGATFIRPNYNTNKLTIKYCVNGGKINKEEFTIKSGIICNADGNSYKTVLRFDEKTKGALPTAKMFGMSKKGFQFIGWENASGKVFTSESVNIRASKLEPQIKNKSCILKLKAAWKANKLSVTYNANGGKATGEDYKIDKDGNIIKISTNKIAVNKWVYNEAHKSGLYNASTFSIERKGYKFIGWSTEKKGDVIFDENDATVLPTDLCPDITKNETCAVTMYARWERI